MTDLGEIVRDPWALLAEQCAERILAGKRPTKAQAEWLAVLRPPSPPQHSSDISRNAKGEMQFDVKAYSTVSLHEAVEESATEAKRLRAMFPMANGTAGAPMREDAQ